VRTDHADKPVITPLFLPAWPLVQFPLDLLPEP